MIPAFHQNNQAECKFQSYFDGSIIELFREGERDQWIPACDSLLKKDSLAGRKANIKLNAPCSLNYQSDMPAALEIHEPFPSNEDTQNFSSFTTTRGCALKYNLKDIAKMTLPIKSAIYSSPFSQQPWLGSYTSRGSKARVWLRRFPCRRRRRLFGCLPTCSTQTKRFFYSSPAIQNCPDYADLKQTLPYELTDIAENYAKF
ncbi:hypothetical protein DSO57_1038585 [Entomophthora muscae]|uniref:Uncharacterized protein n=1 Tax=Entomophthora muscae TaxID=34485 RepID=A0ACC2SYQ1_9FUNG|nr:hypothetical protein DSO57_1038585 [Entomophthora muscae]